MTEKVENRYTVVAVLTKGPYIRLLLAREGQMMEAPSERAVPIAIPTKGSEEEKIAAEMMAATAKMMPQMLQSLAKMDGVIIHDADVPLLPEQYVKLGKPTVGDSVVLVLELEKET